MSYKLCEGARRCMNVYVMRAIWFPSSTSSAITSGATGLQALRQLDASHHFLKRAISVPDEPPVPDIKLVIVLHYSQLKTQDSKLITAYRPTRLLRD